MKTNFHLLSAAIAGAAMTGCHSTDTGKEGAMLLETRCTLCHSVEIPKNVRKSKAEWEKCVSRMIAKGAKLSPAEKKILISYLARVYRP